MSLDTDDAWIDIIQRKSYEQGFNILFMLDTTSNLCHLCIGSDMTADVAVIHITRAMESFKHARKCFRSNDGPNGNNGAGT
jgi:hypothetical protein